MKTSTLTYTALAFLTSFGLCQTSNRPALEDVMFNLEQNDSIAWKDDGTGSGGRIAFIEEPAWQRAEDQASLMDSSPSPSRGSSEVFRVPISGSLDVEVDGQTREVNWFCRDGTAQSLVKNTALSAACGGLAAALVSAEVGRWVWSSPPLPDETGKRRSVVISLARFTTFSITGGSCATLLSQIVGENACGGTRQRRATRPRTKDLRIRQSDSVNAGGDVSVLEGADGGPEIAVFRVGVPA